MSDISVTMTQPQVVLASFPPGNYANGVVYHDPYTVNIRDHGADPTGVSDSTVAIQAAINLANTGGLKSVVIPAGNYKVTGVLTLPASNIEVFGHGSASIITSAMATTTSPVFSAASIDNIRIHDLVITGAHSWGVYISGGSGHRIYRCAISGGTYADIGGSKGGGVYVENASDVVIDRNVLSGNGSADHSISYRRDIEFNFGTYQVTDSWITNNVCSSTNVDVNISVVDSRRVHVNGNIVSGAFTPTTGSSRVGGYGIMLYNVTGGVSPTLVGENTACHNIVRSTEGSGIYVHGSRDSVVANNVTVGTCSVQSDFSLGVGGVVIDDSPGTACTGNRILTSGSSGITVSGQAAPAVGCSYVSVTGNTVRDCTKIGIAIRGPITDVVVSANNVYNTTSHGIGSYSDEAALRITIVGNSVRTVGGVANGIRAEASTVDWMVGYNLISGTGGAATANLGTTNVFADNKTP